MATPRKKLAERVVAEIELRRKLDIVLPLILVPCEAMVRMTTLRRLLLFCGLRPTIFYLTEALAKVNTYVEKTRIKDSTRLVLPGVRVADGCIPRARARLLEEWNAKLRAEGMLEEPHEHPRWLMQEFHHTGGPAPGDVRAAHEGDPDKFSRTVVTLPADWDVEANAERDVRRAAFSAAASAAAAGEYHAKMAEYLWRRCDWRNYSALDRLVVEMHIVDELDAKAIGKRIGRTRACCKAILQRHRALAGIVPRGRQAKR
jgi:hypothetical protein